MMTAVTMMNIRISRLTVAARWCTKRTTVSRQNPTSLGSATSATTRSSEAAAWRKAPSAASAPANLVPPSMDLNSLGGGTPFFSGWSAISGRPSVTDPRVDDRISDVGQEVEQHSQSGDQHDHPEYDRVVAVQGGLEREQPHARPAEDALGDDGATDELRCLQSHQRDDGKDCVAQRVLVADGPRRQSLGFSGAHVVLVEHLQHAGAHEPAEAGDAEDRQRRDREDHVPHEVVQAGGATLVHAKQRKVEIPPGQVSKPDPAGQEEEDAEHKSRHRYPDVARHRCRHIQLGVLAGGREYAEWDGDQQRYDERYPKQQNRVRHPLRQQLAYRLVINVRVTKVPVHQRAQIGGVLLIPGLVEAEVVQPPVDRLLVRPRVLARAERRARSCARQSEEGNRHEEQEQNADQDAPDDVERHALILTFVGSKQHVVIPEEGEGGGLRPPPCVD